MRRVLTILTALLLAPAAAQAATVTVRPSADVDEVYFQAAPGETNHVTVAYAGDARSVTVTDPGATIIPAGTCTMVDVHTATCVARAQSPDPNLQNARVELGDGDDTVVSTRPEPGPPIGGLDADGGPGDDTLTGSPAADVLDGGSGTDTMTGGAGDDTITDGDTTGDPDTMSGGPGDDTLSYAGHTAAVTVDLAASTGPDGDAVTGFENATGGLADDTLTGTADAANVLTGGPGADTLDGRGGSSFEDTIDDLNGGLGDDTLTSGAPGAYLTGGFGRDSFTCARGLNSVVDPSPDEVLARTCNIVIFTLADDDYLRLRTYPRVVAPAAVTFPFGCPAHTGRCEGKLVLRRVGANPQKLGAGAIDGDQPVIVHLKRRFARLARRPDGVTTAVTIKPGNNLPKVGWRIVLKL